MTMSMHLDHRPHRVGRHWSRHVVDKVATEWNAGLPVKVIARHLVAAGIVITPMQIHNMARHHRFPPRTRHSTETIAQIRKLWGDGYSASRIGKSLKLTLGQVMGVIHHRGFERKTEERFTLLRQGYAGLAAKPFEGRVLRSSEGAK